MGWRKCLLAVLCVSCGLANAQSAGHSASSQTAINHSSLGTAQVGQPQSSEPVASQTKDAAIFPHSDSKRYWVSGQANLIFQRHSRFTAPYTGINSLRPEPEHALSRLLTLYAGYQLAKNTEILFAPESAGGRGISDTLGLAGFTNLDVVRNPELGARPYISRLMIHQIIALNRGRVAATRGPLSLATELPSRRLEIRFGKLALAEFFDFNSAGSDSHLQFLNWTADNNGAYDYAADTRGYTWAALFDYEEARWGLRFAEALMPKVANGNHLDANLARARSENIELELRPSLLPSRRAAFRLLAFVNHANMGTYREAVEDFIAGKTPAPDVTAHPHRTTIKYGFGGNFEQSLNDWLLAYGRWGWNEGRHESYAYTEVDQTYALGLALDAKHWRRKLDRAGITFVSNGISRDHQKYLALGGRGFLLGDGRLNYRRENIFEAYYTAHVWRGVFASIDLQHINNPGYNRDRGPVTVPAVRLHVEF